MVFLIRVRGLLELGWKMNPLFSALLVPFVLLWVSNILLWNDSARLLTGLLMIVYLSYDLWHRAITRRKPYRPPERWPVGLVVYLLLLFAGSIGLNWYGYLTSQLFGNVFVVAFSFMMSSFGNYQYKHNKGKKIKENHSGVGEMNETTSAGE